MVTRVSREKNIAEILRYFPALLRAMPQAQIIIVDERPERRRLEALAEKKGLSGHVCFTGRIDPDEVYQYYALGDVFVSASTFETQGLTYLEAMACGLPLVCREDPVLQGVLENEENGYAYQSEREFVDHIVRILTDRKLRQAMHAKALDKAKECSAARFVDRINSLYGSMIKVSEHA